MAGNNGDANIILYDNGTSENLTGVWDSSSDATMKRDVVDIEPTVASNRILALRPVHYRFLEDIANRDPNYVWSGLIAQEWLEVYPTQNGEAAATSEVSIAGVKQQKLTMNTGQIQFDLIAAHQHAIARITALEARLTAAGL